MPDAEWASGARWKVCVGTGLPDKADEERSSSFGGGRGVGIAGAKNATPQ
ncbi:MAG: hypothetical protein LBO81_01630 [Clostridiales Family XIII bacterium]|jgi:hypothetical protein|nr:hypothetical protein [Clostridiales Family XIII bacterium]